MDWSIKIWSLGGYPINNTKLFSNGGKDGGKDFTKELTERQRIIIGLLNEDGTLTSQKISQKDKVTTRTIIQDMKILQQLGLIRRVGGRKSGHWEVVQ